MANKKEKKDVKVVKEVKVGTTKKVLEAPVVSKYPVGYDPDMPENKQRWVR